MSISKGNPVSEVRKRREVGRFAKAPAGFDLAEEIKTTSQGFIGHVTTEKTRTEELECPCSEGGVEISGNLGMAPVLHERRPRGSIQRVRLQVENGKGLEIS